MDEPPLATRGRLRNLDADGASEPMTPAFGALACRRHAVTGRKLP
jgi:hypothetical protein